MRVTVCYGYVVATGLAMACKVFGGASPSALDTTPLTEATVDQRRSQHLRADSKLASWMLTGQHGIRL